MKTIKSRALEIKIILNQSQRLDIINKLVDSFKLELILDPKSTQLSPGNFVKFNYICKECDINPLDNFIENLSLLLNLYKKNKNIIFINLIFFITDYYFKYLKENKLFNNDKLFTTKNR